MRKLPGRAKKCGPCLPESILNAIRVLKQILNLWKPILKTYRDRYSADSKYASGDPAKTIVLPKNVSWCGADHFLRASKKPIQPDILLTKKAFGWSANHVFEFAMISNWCAEQFFWAFWKPIEADTLQTQNMLQVILKRNIFFWQEPCRSVRAENLSCAPWKLIQPDILLTKMPSGDPGKSRLWIWNDFEFVRWAIFLIILKTYIDRYPAGSKYASGDHGKSRFLEGWILQCALSHFATQPWNLYTKHSAYHKKKLQVILENYDLWNKCHKFTLQKNTDIKCTENWGDPMSQIVF